MTPKEKAQELVNKMLDKQEYSDVYQERGIISWPAKQCALIAVDEIIENQKNDIAKFESQLFLNGIKVITFSTYWQQVKHEIEKL